MSVIIETAPIIAGGSTANGTINNVSGSVASNRVSETPSLDGESLENHSMRTGSVKLARLHYLMTLGDRVGKVETNAHGVKRLVVHTSEYGAIRILDFTETRTAHGLAHPYRIQRLRYDPEDYYVNADPTQSTKDKHQMTGIFIQGGISEPEIRLEHLLDAVDHLLCSARKSGLSRNMIRRTERNGSNGSSPGFPPVAA
jgi:hypothetical protein